MNILIIGGTGSLGQKLIEHYYDKKNRIVIFSRDELKQANLKKKYPYLECIIGDIRDSEAVSSAFSRELKYDIVFHCAALKHVDLGEENVSQFVKTNYSGTKILFDYASSYGSEKFVFFTTDKAVFPINAYGMSKALSEKYLQQIKCWERMPIYIFRWGNILGSRGSCLDYFKDCLLNKKPVEITDIECTRFWLLLDDAIDFVTNVVSSDDVIAYADVYIPEMKSASILDLLKSIHMVLKNKGHDILPFDDCYIETGLRLGEKVHENIYPDLELNSYNFTKYNIFELMLKIERML